MANVNAQEQYDQIKKTADAAGTAADAEATGNGSVIGILKRIRTLIGDSLVTLGSAVGSAKGQLMAGSDGTNARALKTSSDGTLLTQVTGNYVKLVKSHIGNAGLITNSSMYYGETASTAGGNNTHLDVSNYSKKAIHVSNNHDVAIKVDLVTGYEGSNPSSVALASILASTVTIAAGSSATIDERTHPDINALYPYIRARISRDTVAPTTGSIDVRFYGGRYF